MKYSSALRKLIRNTLKRSTNKSKILVHQSDQRRFLKKCTVSNSNTNIKYHPYTFKKLIEANLSRNYYESIRRT